MALREGSNRRPPPSPANYPHVGIITPRNHAPNGASKTFMKTHSKAEAAKERGG